MSREPNANRDTPSIGTPAARPGRMDPPATDRGQPQVQSGLTFLEALIGVAILGVLTAMTLPTFKGFVESMRLDAQTDRFVSAVQTARTMAISNNTPVTLCAVDVDGNCSSSPSAWSREWSVFYDCNANSSIDTTAVCADGQPEPVYVRDTDGTAQWSLSMAHATDSIPTKISFDSNGIPITAYDCWGMAFRLASQDGSNPRLVLLSAQGRVFTTNHGHYDVDDDCNQIAMAATASSSSTGGSSSGGDTGSGSSSGGEDSSGSSSGSSGDGSSSGSEEDGSSSGDGSSGSGSGGSSSSSSSGGEEEDPEPLCTNCAKEDWCTKVDEEYLAEGITIPLGNSDNYVTITSLDFKEGDEKIGFTLLTSNNFQVKFGESVDFLNDQIVGAIEWESDAPNYQAISHVVFCVPNSYQLDGDYTGFPEWEP